jgi:hypothetical protein
MNRFKAFLFGTLLVFASTGWALDPCYSGSYYNPETVGTGIDIQVSEDIVAVYRYGYLGTPNYWVGATENIGDFIEVDMSATRYLEDGTITEFVVGDVTLAPTETGLHFTWHWSLDLRRDTAIPWCLGEQCVGEEELIPLFNPTPCE